jgi:hypothetical protein
VQVLQGVDFSRLKVKVMLVEANGLDKQKDLNVQRLLEDNGFVLSRTNQYNQIYVHSTFLQPSKKPS